MERCGFFDAELVGEEYDRSYLAEQFAAYFASFIGNGVFGGKSDELQIVAMENPSMQVAGLSGQGWINGYWYENTDELYLPVDVADGVLDRIDSVVLRLGFAERDMWITVKRGVPSNNPQAPELVRNADYYELQLATIYIKAGALNIKQADITDTRLDSNVCGFVVAVVNEFDTAAFYAQLNSWIELFQLESVEQVNALVEQLEAIINAGDIGPLVTDIQNLKDNKVNKSGDTMTDDLRISRNIQPSLRLIVESTGTGGVVQAGTNQLLLGARQVANDLNNTRILTVNDAVLNPDIENAVRLIDKVNGTETSYDILHTGNMHLINALAGDVKVSKSSQPSVRLEETANGAGAVIQLGNNQLLLSSRNVFGSTANYRLLTINNSVQSPDVANALRLTDMVNGSPKYYDLVHTGNMHLYGIGIVPASVE